MRAYAHADTRTHPSSFLLRIFAARSLDRDRNAAGVPSGRKPYQGVVVWGLRGENGAGAAVLGGLLLGHPLGLYAVGRARGAPG